MLSTLQRKIKKSNPTFPEQNPTSPIFGAQKGSRTRTTPRPIGGPTCAHTTQSLLSVLPLAPSAPWRSSFYSARSASSRPLVPRRAQNEATALHNVPECSTNYSVRNKPTCHFGRTNARSTASPNHQKNRHAFACPFISLDCQIDQSVTITVLLPSVSMS